MRIAKSLKNQQLVANQLLDKLPAEFYSAEGSMFSCSLKTSKQWTFYYPMFPKKASQGLLLDLCIRKIMIPNYETNFIGMHLTLRARFLELVQKGSQSDNS